MYRICNPCNVSKSNLYTPLSIYKLSPSMTYPCENFLSVASIRFRLTWKRQLAGIRVASMEGDWRWCPEERERERKVEGQGRTQCPKGVFRNRGKMEENRYSLVAGKSRVERAKRGRTRGGGGCRNSTAWKRESRAHLYRGARIHSRTLHIHVRVARPSV